MFAARPSLLDDRILILTGLMMAAMIVGAMIIAAVDRWRKREAAQSVPEETLSSYRTLYEDGELSQVEYDRIRARYAQRLRKKLAGGQPTQPTNLASSEPLADIPLDDVD